MLSRPWSDLISMLSKTFDEIGDDDCVCIDQVSRVWLMSLIKLFVMVHEGHRSLRGLGVHILSSLSSASKSRGWLCSIGLGEQG